ncbi:hypothetical protein OSG_eHP23_00035 [environmental Halophage eHP-23]|nr:hypothetical protein OSG_eHP23_00035 [environmental Halophage eHP-23]
MTEQITLRKGDTLPKATLQLTQASPRNLDIVGVDTTADEFVIENDWTDLFTAGREFEVVKSTGNNDDYTVSGSSYDSGNDQTTITVKQDITDSTADGQITFEKRIPVNLSGASVKIYVYDTGKDDFIIDGDNVTLLDAAKGKIQYQFSSTQVEETGVFPGEIIATYSDGDLTFPNQGYIKIMITEDVQGGI